MEPLNDTHAPIVADDVDLTNCDREAIHIPGAIQPHGALLAVDGSSGAVVIASENATRFLGTDDAVLGREIDDVMPGLGLGAAFTNLGARRRLLTSTLAGEPCSIVLHRMQGLDIVEVERGDVPLAADHLLNAVDVASSIFGDTRNLAETYRWITSSIFELTGFDRTFVYLFENDGHGVVADEQFRPDLEPLLGQRYPASDIPRQARALYLRNWTRLICDSAGEASRLEALADRAGHPLNLGMSQLRAVSPIHLEYLRNMGVGASFSVSIVERGQLAGLICCHDREPKHIPYAIRTVCEMLARQLSIQLSRANLVRRADLDHARVQIQVRALRRIAETTDINAAIAGVADDTTPFMRADGFLSSIGGHEHRSGTPALTHGDIRRALDDEPLEALIATTAIGDVSHAGGAAIARIDLPDAPGYLAWIRNATERSLVWGGDPTQARSGTKTLTPRASFEPWTETILHPPDPWEPAQTLLAESIGRLFAERASGEASDPVAMIDALTRYVDDLEQTNRSLLQIGVDSQEMVSAVAHDLRAPLRTISMFADLLAQRARTGTGQVVDLAERIVTGAQQMSELLDGLQRWTVLGQPVEAVAVDLDDTARDLIASLAASIDAAEGSVTVGPLPTVTGDPIQLRELLQNLIENGLKYRHPDRRPEIEITAATTESSVVITVDDNGRGISPEQLEKIFGMFVQLDRDAMGIGLGLTLVSRIADRHGGRVWADSVVGSGTSFHVELPLAGTTTTEGNT